MSVSDHLQMERYRGILDSLASASPVCSSWRERWLNSASACEVISLLAAPALQGVIRVQLKVLVKNV